MATPIRVSTTALLAAIALTSIGDMGAARAQSRLSGNVLPSRYAVTLEPDLAAATFRGSVVIDVRIKKPTTTIVIHAVDMMLSDTHLSRGRRRYPLSAVTDDLAGTATLTARKALPAGRARLHLSFTAPLDQRLRGFYLARSGEERFALTDLEPSDARRVFPCFDEPAFKARFQTTAIVPKGMVAVSNTVVAGQQRDAATGKDRIIFAETLPISTYLFTLAIGPFESRSLEDFGIAVPGGDKKGSRRGRRDRKGRARKSHGVPMSLYAVKGKAQLGRYALDASARILPLLNDYFGIDYPFGKLDIIAAPEFAHGGMENVGAIYYNDGLVLIDEATVSPRRERVAVNVIAHEIAHQWFGDLVTMEWWDDIWLNEAFATWMSYRISDGLKPEWKLWREFTARRQGAFWVDSLSDTHPIRAPVTGVEEAWQKFDPAITYGKGSAVLRMIEHYAGSNPFRKGIRAYMKKHKFKNTKDTDLWRALERASGKPIGKTARAWIERPGYPVLEVATRCDKGRGIVSVKQRRFMASGKPAIGDPWPVPACFRYSVGRRVVEQCNLVRKREQQVALRHGCPEWLVGNSRSAGFYRVAYDQGTFAALIAARARLLPEERLTLLADLRSLWTAGAVPTEEFATVLASFSDERDPVVLESVASAFGVLLDRVVDEEGRPRLQKMARSLFHEIAEETGTTPDDKDDEDRLRLRSVAISALALQGVDAATIDWASKRVDSYLKHTRKAWSVRPENPASAVPRLVQIHPSIIGALVTIAARHGDEKRYAAYQDRALASPLPEERDRFLYSLAHFPGETARNKTLDLLLSDSLRNQEVRRLMAGLLARPDQQKATWKFMKANFDALLKRTTEQGMSRLIPSLGSLCSNRDATDVRAFFKEHRIKGAGKGVGRYVGRAVETIGICARASKRSRPELSSWLDKSRTSPAAPEKK